MVKKIRNPETGRMVNVTGKIGQKVLSQRGGGKDKRRKSANRRNSKKTSYRRNSKKSQKKPLHGGKPPSLVGRLQNMSSHLSSKLGADLCVDIASKEGWDLPGSVKKVQTCQDIDNINKLRRETDRILKKVGISNLGDSDPSVDLPAPDITNIPSKDKPHYIRILTRASAHIRNLINLKPTDPYIDRTHNQDDPRIKLSTKLRLIENVISKLK